MRGHAYNFLAPAQIGVHRFNYLRRASDIVSEALPPRELHQFGA